MDSWTWNDGFQFNKSKEFWILSNPREVEALKLNPFDPGPLLAWSWGLIPLDGTAVPCELPCSTLDSWLSLAVPVSDICVNTLKRKKKWHVRQPKIAKSGMINTWECNYPKKVNNSQQTRGVTNYSAQSWYWNINWGFDCIGNLNWTPVKLRGAKKKNLQTFDNCDGLVKQYLYQDCR